ncbi:MAG: DUF262 domain-containing protein [Tissierellales bacterium]|nr:DUF262 domain-containing protein [Tissierellales bacterium]
MSITPRGMSVQEAYRIYCDGGFHVNRKYQRKLVWTVQEKEYLIDSIINGLPIPLILLASIRADNYEIIDGLQRLNAIFSYIENRFTYKEKYFDVNQSSRAKQISEQGVFQIQNQSLLEAKLCANYLDYQLAVTIYPNADEKEITDIFGRINSGGKQLSNQEKRQAGMLDIFSGTVRIISSELRGDSSNEILPLHEMPEISIDSSRENIGYGIKADDVFWCKHGILTKAQLRDSEDEEMIADILSSIILREPINRSKDLFDKIYDSNSDEHKNILRQLNSYGVERIKHEITVTVSIFKEILEKSNGSPNFKSVVNPKSQNPVKNSFYSIFMALFDLVVRRELSPENYNSIVASITKLQSKITASAHYATTDDRKNNINLTQGLIQPYFVKKDPPVLTHGPGLLIDIENSIRRSKTESNRYECKQGLYDLTDKRNYDKNILSKLVDTACGIANVGPDADGYIFIGVADKPADVKRIIELDKISPYELTNLRTIVGIDRELKIEGIKIDDYCRRILSFFEKSQLTDALKNQILSQFDLVDIHGYSVIRIRVPKQKNLSFVGKRCFIREGSNTIEIEGPKLISASELFNK